MKWASGQSGPCVSSSPAGRCQPPAWAAVHGVLLHPCQGEQRAVRLGTSGGLSFSQRIISAWDDDIQESDLFCFVFFRTLDITVIALWSVLWSLDSGVRARCPGLGQLQKSTAAQVIAREMSLHVEDAAFQPRQSPQHIIEMLMPQFQKTAFSILIFFQRFHRL